MRLVTERLIITYPRKKDVFEVYAHRTDDKANLFTGGIVCLSWQDFQKKYLVECDDRDAQREHVYSVILRESDKYIGYCGFQYCRTLKAIEILFGYSSRYWGRGYALEAAKAVLAHGMDNLGFDRVEAAVNPKNPVSESILRKIGMEYVSEVEWPGQGAVSRYAITRERFLNLTNPFPGGTDA